MSEARPLSKGTKLAIGITILLLMIVAGGIVRMAFDTENQKEQKEVAQAGQAAEQADKKDLAAEVKKVCDAGGEPAKKLGSLCTKAKEIIQEPTKTVETGLNEVEVRNIVKEEVAKSNLTLTPAQVQTVATAASRLVKPGRDGKTPTKAELQPLVSTALATFCANDACRGKDGADAPAVTEAQLSARLAAYCEPRNNCVGDDGKDGGEGPRGPAGRGVTVSTSPAEGGGGTLVTFTYTDDTPAVSFVVKDGAQGNEGPKGKDAFPFTFSFVIPADPPATQDRTYTCTVQTPTEPVNCVLQQ